MTDVISNELKYDTTINNHSSIQYRNVAPQASGSVTTNVVSSTGPTEFLFSPAVFSPAKSRLEFTVSVGASPASRFNFIDANVLTTISRLVIYDSATNAVLGDISNFDKYISVVNPLSTSFQDFCYKSNGDVDTVLSIAQKKTVEDMSRNANIASSESTTTTAGTVINTLTDLYSLNYDGNGTPLQIINPSFSRKQYYIGKANAATILDVSIPFSAFKGTVLSYDKMLYFPSNLVIQIYWNACNQYAFTGGDDAGATAAAKYLPTANVLSLANAVTISNLNVALACESNLTIISEVMKTVMSSGISFNIPYPTVTRQSIALSNSQSFSLQLTRAYGSRILYLLSAPFITGGVNNTANVFHRLVGQNGAGTADYIQQYNTFLNNVPIKYSAGFNCDRSEDYILGNKMYSEGSVIQTIQEYTYNTWFHCDSFFGEKPLKDINYMSIDGLDVGSASSTWQLQATIAGAGLATTWITVIMGSKNLTISGMGSQVM